MRISRKKINAFIKRLNIATFCLMVILIVYEANNERVNRYFDSIRDNTFDYNQFMG